MSLHGGLMLYPPGLFYSLNTLLGIVCYSAASVCVCVCRVILHFPLPMRSVVTVCLYQSVEGSLQVPKICQSSLRSHQ